MGAVATTIDGLSTTAGSNNPQGSDIIGANLDDTLRTMQAVTRLFASPNSIVSATTTDLSTVADTFITVSGTTTITGLGTVTSGIYKWLIFSGALILTHNGTSLIIPGAANITTAAGDMALALSLGAGNWRVLTFTKASAAPVTLSPITNSLGSDVSLNSTGTYFDGPSVAQGTAGTWFVSGTVTVKDTAGAADMDVKLWDGTTVIASAFVSTNAAGTRSVVALSGYIPSPAGNLRISVKDASSTGGKIAFNESGNSKDSTITALRVA